MIELSLQKEGRANIIVGGDIVSETAEELRTVLEEALSKGCHFIYLDVAKAQYINSSGLGLLIGLHSKLKSKNGALTLENVTADFYEILQSANLIQALNFGTTPDAPKKD